MGEVTGLGARGWSRAGQGQGDRAGLGWGLPWGPSPLPPRGQAVVGRSGVENTSTRNKGRRFRVLWSWWNSTTLVMHMKVYDESIQLGEAGLRGSQWAGARGQGCAQEEP